MLKQKYTVEVEGMPLSFSTGTLAQRANGSVMVQSGDTVVFVSATMAKEVAPDQDFFPLTVDYREKFSAAGRFPGGYIKREGKPTEKEILTSRLCDRPLRPLFPSDFLNEVQIIGLLLSTDLKHESDILMVNGASAALMCSDIPWGGPIGCVRIAQVNGEFVINPTNNQQFDSDLDLIYVGTRDRALMIEGCADQLPEARFIEALHKAQQAIQPILDAQEALARQVGRVKSTYVPHVATTEAMEWCKSSFTEPLRKAWFNADRSAADEGVRLLKQSAFQMAIDEKWFDDEEKAKEAVSIAFEALQEDVCRKAVLDQDQRLDGRSLDEIRQLSCAVDVLPKRVHGSALFERGQTQALVSVTLGTNSDAQDLDGLTGGAQSKSFILHYNFPPYSTGETGRFGFLSRREVGHGALAERSLLPVIPSENDFPYAIRVVSDIMSSNGSTSMASVCGGTLALMDAGVPILAPVSGISIGLVTEMDQKGSIARYKLLTDIIGDEDHYGDMDFKICGTDKGITGFQLDLKIAGLPLEIMEEAIHQNTQARARILEVMKGALAQPRTSISPFAPRIATVMISPDKIGALIGPGGKNIKHLTESTGCQIDICEDNSGKVSIYACDEEMLKKVVEQIQALDQKIEVGKTYQAIVKSIKDFGVFVECLPGQEGLVHVSELSDCRVKHPSDVCALGDTMVVTCVGIDEKGRVRLSRKAVIQHEAH